MHKQRLAAVLINATITVSTHGYGDTPLCEGRHGRRRAYGIWEPAHYRIRQVCQIEKEKSCQGESVLCLGVSSQKCGGSPAHRCAHGIN